MKFQVYFLLGTSLSYFPGLAFGQCVVTEDCAALGYTASSCNGGKGVKCPFGNGWFCAEDESTVCAENGFKYTCTGTGYAGGAGSACGGKYAQCTCASGYEWKDGACISSHPVCEVGWLYYSDDTCSANLESGKILLGVVIYSNGATGGGWIMTVKPIKTNIAWDTGAFYETGIKDRDINASCTNTQKLVALGRRFAAANAAYNYEAGGKKWCLPSLNLLSSFDNVPMVTKINNAIRLAGGILLGDVCQKSGYVGEDIWSSSEAFSDQAYVKAAAIMDDDGSVGTGCYNRDKGAYKPNSVRPVLPF